MPTSPLLQGVTDPLKMLRIIKDNPILGYTEGSRTFSPLKDEGWVEYAGGRWRITDEGRETLSGYVEKPVTFEEFFNL